MKIRLEYHDITFQLERQPLSEGRFRVLIRLAAALCGFRGLVTVVVATAVVAVFHMASF